ncbi:MAG: hypothetical protein U0K93_04335, partial [Acutalibacteraceae bacterium]|nr:hypothetical protein [Acutalibacteraceae bacterium]
PARANITKYHECSRSTAPTLGLVRTLSTAANRVQIVLLDDVTHLGIFGGAVQADFEPVRFSDTCYPFIQLRHLRLLFPN